MFYCVDAVMFAAVVLDDQKIKLGNVQKRKILFSAVFD